MTRFQWLLGFHVVAAFLFVSGAVAAGLLQLAAERQERPADIVRLLRLVRPAVVAVSLGALGAVGLGIWLVEDFGFDWGEGWITGAFVLWAVSVALGAIGGRQARHVRYLAGDLAVKSDDASPELRRALADPLARIANYGSLAAALAILGLMIWKPGA